MGPCGAPEAWQSYVLSCNAERQLVKEVTRVPLLARCSLPHVLPTHRLVPDPTSQCGASECQGLLAANTCSTDGALRQQLCDVVTTVARHAQVLAATEPMAAVAAFREQLESALAGVQDADRPRTYAAAEVLAGLLASGALFAAVAGAQSACHQARKPLSRRWNCLMIFTLWQSNAGDR